jgi:serpin B
MFSTDLYHHLSKPPGNLFFSPYSIGAALALVHAGADGAVRRELEDLLGDADPVRSYGTLGRELARRSEPSPRDRQHLQWMKDVPAEAFGCHLSVANAMWRQKGYAVRPEFVEVLRSRFGAEVGEADFTGQPAEAVRAVNEWAGRATRDKIRQILQEKQLDPETRVILANAIYFKARWGTEFSEGATRPAPFRLLNGRTVQVPTMHSLGPRSTAREGNLQALTLPYTGEALAMMVILPDPGKFDQVERELDGTRLERLAGAMRSDSTEVALPRFRVESSFMLGAPLRDLGLKTAFSSRADFSRISPEPGFALGEVLHKTFVDVNEKGTEAAAVTVPMMAGSAPPQKKVEFRADRPFLFVIRDLPTSTLLFMGRVADPRP